jgi:hypothetical protein
MPMVVKQLHNCQHSPFCLLHVLPKVCGPFFMDLAVRAMFVRALAYRGRHSTIWEWIRGRVIAKSTFTVDGQFLKGKKDS